MEHLISKAETLLEALPYILRFSGETFVVKYGGSFMDSQDESVRTGVARDIVFLEAVGINPIVVHGGGKAITRAMEKAGLNANFIQGQRVTDEATVQVVEGKVDIGYSAPGSRNVLWSLKRGQPTQATFKQLCAAAEVQVDVQIKLPGRGAALMYASDLTEEYVEFNKGDVTDPATLGG